MYWDEDNRLMVLSDNGKTSRYTYNATGERIMKSYGTMEGVYINGAPQGITFHETDNFTLYPASILSVNKNRFTKHYFLGDKRIASRIGTGLFNNVYGRNGSYVTAGQQDYVERMNQIQKQKEAYYKQQGIAPGVPTMKGAYDDPENTKRGYNSIIDTLGNHDVPQGWIQTPRPNTTPNTNPGPPVSWNDPSNPDDPQAGYGYIPNDTTKEETFFYHSDHLGSTSYITDDHANITQYDAYLPYGELLVDEHSSSEKLPYKFNGKQFDEETGLYYYGARYVNPIASIWYGVDRLAEKYSQLSSFSYCAGNPIKYVDLKGDSLNMSNVIMMDKYYFSNNLRKITKDLSLITGLNISVSGNYLQYERNTDGSPIYNQGSETARNFLIDIIDGPNIDVFVGQRRSVTPHGQKQVGLSSSQIENFINHTFNLNPATLGWGMTLLHELHHTGPGGSMIDTDELFGTGNVVDAMNVIRQELNMQWKNFGQRLNYKSIIPNEKATSSFLPFDRSSLNSIKMGMNPSPFSQYIEINVRK
ncbi:hypothetical protein JCM17724A_23390 [Prevotella fusca JCM 17724]|nr:RHS repeat-associated core domain-containing protein [Prevotella fusca]